MFQRLIKHQKILQKELTAKSFQVSLDFTSLTAKTNYNLTEVLPSTQRVIMGWQAYKSTIQTGRSVDLCVHYNPE